MNKEKKNLKKYKIFLPITGIVTGILLTVLFFAADLSGIVFVIAAVMIVISSILLKKWWGSIGEDESRVIVTDKNVPSGRVNSMNIYPDKIRFEEVEEPKGQPWKCENDSKSYHIHIFDEETELLKEFQLPDQAYMDPQLLASRVLELPAHRRIFRRKQTLLQQLSPMMAAFGVIIMWIIIITTI